MGYLECDKCGVSYELQGRESIDDFDLKCKCGGKLAYKESIKSNVSKDLEKVKWILMFSGFVLILMYLAGFSKSKSPFDLFYLTVGIMVVLWGFYIKDGFKGTTTYFVATSCVNLFQWLILIYILFISQAYVTNDLYILAFAPLVTLSLISQIRRSELKYIGNTQKTNKDVILADKMKLLLNNKAKVLLISSGFAIIVVCIGSFLFSKDPVELFGSAVGLMIMVYGNYRETKNVVPPDYAKDLSHNSIFYRETSKVKVTANYFLSMMSVLIFQWLILYYIAFIRPYTVPNEGVPTAFSISIMATMFFYMQIRESHLIKINWKGIFIGDKKVF